MQDWEIECANPSRVAEFLDCYAAEAKTDDERFTLMALVLGSFEEYHGTAGPDSQAWGRIAAILKAEHSLHQDHITYYRCDESDDPEHWFPITPLMRQLSLGGHGI